MTKSLKSCLLFFILITTVTALPLGLQAQVDPRIEWSEIETDSAIWLFDAKQQDLANYYISQFERAKTQVSPLFNEAPRKPTIILLDNTDQANGSARVTPHPIIVLYTVQPNPYSSIGEFRDYVHELLVHEYTHILNMEPVHGWMSPFYWVFGSIAHPNMVLPRWYTEGLAVYTESAISKSGGRLNSQYVQALARSLTLENKWQDYPLSDLNDFHPDWLGGSRAYLFGGILWDGITQKGGDEIIEKLNQSYSRRIPYFLDGVIESYLGVDYDEQLATAFQAWQSKAQKQIDTIKASAQLQGEELKLNKDSFFMAPSISPDGLWLAYVRFGKDAVGDIQLTLRHPQSGFRAHEAKTVVKRSRSRNIAWHPASTGFVYAKMKRYKSYYNFLDLHFYDLQKKKSKRLTKGERAHTPCFSAIGKTLYYLKNIPGTKQIKAMDWLTQKTSVIYEGNMGDDLNFLSCAQEKLYFVEHKSGKKSHIAVFDLSTKQKTVFYDEKDIHYLRNTHLGLLFSSPDSGVDNLYLINDKEPSQVRAITNSMTRALKADIDPLDDSLYFSQAQASGAKMFYLKEEQWKSLPDQPPQVEGLFTARTPQADLATEPVSTANTHKAEEFSPWRYMLPNHWIPFVYFVDGGTLFQALTSAGDPLGINTISLVGQWDTLTKEPGASISYVNNSTPVTLGAAVSDFHNWFYPTSTSLHFSNASAFFAKPLDFLDNTRVLFRWNYSQLEFSNDIFIRQGPNLALAYNASKANPDDISTSSGWKGQLGHRNFLADLGNTSYGETFGHLGTFWSSFTPKRHVFYLGLNGSYAPKLTNSFFATSTLAGPFFNPQFTNTTFLQRGYPTGIFVARNIVNINAEYRFPVWSMFSGFTAPPVFFRNLQAALVYDASSLDGLYSNSVTRGSQFTDFGTWFSGYGIEFESKINVGFHVPVAFTLGFYYGQNEDAFGGFNTFFNVRL